jgi:drug/metabolite transporter (DMT)-like permease
MVADTGISALALAFWREITTFAVLFLGLTLLRPTWLRVQRTDLLWFVALGSSLGIFHIFWNTGVLLNGAAVATVQQSAMPAIVVVAAWFIWHESLTWREILAVIMTFIGTVAVSGLNVLSQVELSLSSLLIGLGIPVTYAAWTLLSKQVRKRYNAFTTLTYTFAFGTMILLPFQFIQLQPWRIQPSSLLWFAGLISLAGIIPFSMYTFALGRLPASVATILAMSEIIFAPVYAYFLLGERLKAGQILGAILIVGGVLILAWRRWQNNTKRV